MSDRSFMVIGFWQDGEPFSTGVVEIPPGVELTVTGGEYAVDMVQPLDYEGPWALAVEAIDPDTAEGKARNEMRGDDDGNG